MRIFLRFLSVLFCGLWLWMPCSAKEIVLLPTMPEILLEGENIENTTAPAFLQSYIRPYRVWRKVEIRSASEELYLLEGLSPHVKEMRVWILDRQRLSEQVAGRSRPFAQRFLSHKNFTFPLPQGKGAYTIWIAMDHPEEGDIAFKIRSFRFFSEYAFHEYFFLGVYYGFLLVACIYNLFLFLKSRIKLHLYYAAYMAGCVLLSIREDGMGFQFLWPYFPRLNELVVFHLASPLFLLSFLVYSIAFLGLRRQRKVLYSLYFFAIAYLLLEILTFVGLQLQVGLDWLIAFISFLIYFSALRQVKADLYSRYFVLGFSMVIMGLFINLLRYFALIPSNVFTVYGFNYGIFFEVVIFSLALAERVKGIQQERNEALSHLVVQLKENDVLQKRLISELEEKEELQGKVNRELEQKVQERTQDLLSANEKLKAYARKVDELNSALDLHNYSLKKEVKQATLSQLSKAIVRYESFTEVFTGEQACLKAIEQQKWPNGFVCFKCGNTHSSMAKMWYRQKCTRCGTIESVTAHTLFHNVRIPLQKAFYITYLTFVQSGATLEELSEQLDLRKATIWLLRKKVQERMGEMKYKRAQSWQELIVDSPSTIAGGRPSP